MFWSYDNIRFYNYNTNSEYKINKVAISGNGINELYLDIEWEGDNYLDYYELMVLDRNKEYVESCAFATHNHQILRTSVVINNTVSRK